jgi:bloom syndrome protein
MTLKHPPFRKWLASKGTMERVLAVIIDEAHCISQWGGDFRPAYAELEKLQAFFPVHIPIFLTSATFGPSALSDVCSRMKVNLEESFYLNLGNRRPNITTSVIHMDSAKDFKALLKVLPSPESLSSPDGGPKTLVFTNAVKLTQLLVQEVRNYYGPTFCDKIDFLHAHRTRKAKNCVMKRYRKGDIRILIATEAAGMVSFMWNLLPVDIDLHDIGRRYSGH